LLERLVNGCAGHFRHLSHGRTSFAEGCLLAWRGWEDKPMAGRGRCERRHATGADEEIGTDEE
jgi:hypothetical protein